MHDEKKPGDVLKVPGEDLDDVADDVTYGIYPWITSSEMPIELKMRAAVKDLAERLHSHHADESRSGIQRTAGPDRPSWGMEIVDYERRGHCQDQLGSWVDNKTKVDHAATAISPIMPL